MEVKKEIPKELLEVIKDMSKEINDDIIKNHKNEVIHQLSVVELVVAWLIENELLHLNDEEDEEDGPSITEY